MKPLRVPKAMRAALALLLVAALSACATVQAPSPHAESSALQEPSMTTIHEQIAAAAPRPEAWIRVWKPDSAPPGDAGATKGIVIAWHSFRDNAGAWEELGPQWAARGWWVVAPDVAGHGRHPGSFGHLPADVSSVVDEARSVVEAARAHWRETQGAAATAGDARPENPPTLLVGESMGGSIALLVAARHGDALNVRGVATAGAGLRGGIRARWAWDPAIRLSGWLLPWIRFHVDPDYSTTLSPAAAQRFADDPTVIRDVRLDTYTRVVWLAQAATEEVPAVTAPAVYLWGGQDRTILRSSICAAALAHPQPASALVIDRADWPHLVFQIPEHRSLGDQMATFFDDPEAFVAAMPSASAPTTCDAASNTRSAPQR